MNPFRSLAPALIHNNFDHQWVSASFISTIITSICYRPLFPFQLCDPLRGRLNNLVIRHVTVYISLGSVASSDVVKCTAAQTNKQTFFKWLPFAFWGWEQAIGHPI